MDNNVSRRKLITGIVGTAVGMTVAGVLSQPAEAHQPHMQAALGFLQQALAELQASEHDKGGHRERAVDFTQRAINQVQAGENYAR